MKYVIGITGPIGSGKSTVLRILRELGAEIIDADRVAREVMARGGPAYEAVVRAFGRDILRPDGEIDRARLAQKVFSQPEALKRLEAIVHPAVFEEVKRRIARSEKPVIALEAIKLLEAGLSITMCDEVWAVLVDRDVQLQRLRRRGMSEAEALRRMAAQLSPEEYARRADVVIDNNGDLDHLRSQVEAQWRRIMATLARSAVPEKGGEEGSWT